MKEAGFCFACENGILQKTHLMEGLKEDPDSARLKARLSYVLAKLGELDEALELAKAAVHGDPEDEDCHFYLGRVYEMRGEREKARKVFEDLISMDPEYSGYYNRLASVFYDMNDYESCKTTLEKSLELNPENAYYRTMYANCLEKQGDYKEAMEHIEISLEKDPEEAYTHNIKAWLLRYDKQYERSVHHYKEALRFDPSYDNARKGMGIAIKKWGRFFPEKLSRIGDKQAAVTLSILGFILIFFAVIIAVDKQEYFVPWILIPLQAILMAFFRVWEPYRVYLLAKKHGAGQLIVNPLKQKELGSDILTFSFRTLLLVTVCFPKVIPLYLLTYASAALWASYLLWYKSKHKGRRWLGFAGIVLVSGLALWILVLFILGAHEDSFILPFVILLFSGIGIAGIEILWNRNATGFRAKID